MTKKYWLPFILLLFLFACKKETTVNKYDLSKIVGVFSGNLKIHSMTRAPDGTYINSDTSYNTSVTVHDVGVGGKFFSISSDHFLWTDSTYKYYPFDTAYKYLPVGICFTRSGDTIYIAEESLHNTNPYYQTYFVGVK